MLASIQPASGNHNKTDLGIPSDSENGGNALDYTDLTSCSPRLLQLFHALDLDVDIETIQYQLSLKHSYDQRSFVEVVPGVSFKPDLLTLNKLFQVHFFEHNSTQFSEIGHDGYRLSGVLLPREPGITIHDLYWCDSKGNKLQMEIGLPSPFVRQSNPDNPAAATARFKFKPGALPRTDHAEQYTLVVELPQPVVIASASVIPQSLVEKS